MKKNQIFISCVETRCIEQKPEKIDNSNIFFLEICVFYSLEIFDERFVAMNSLATEIIL